ncbi:carboxylate-amine ligase [Kibdelosporangium phytohabitans]|uniref:Putative glutamate--cysteine ligase 2 n=1 Tax=Kibdelosporangium phytohabitans TaxID=860235 RepID=A0A0N9IEW1_9PSEU|nr:glutamate--cysteine ligase [Kibdelosporangium phytohabitans]ALG15062.1 carboxylate--amine ligase [Kibdelosporangium phytohabitans]MBE1468769.1 carboxylate-amine ligase [Kibdelosporangium phytohabitans]
MSEQLTFGVEEEFFVVDHRGGLSGHAAALVHDADDHDGELQTELNRSQAELATGICRTHDELLGQLNDLRTGLAVAGERRGLRLVPSGAALVAEADPPGLTANPRYQRMADHFGAVIDQVTTCGCHVHVGIPDAEAGVHVINHVRPWLPLLLTLTANSPIESGADTGYSSWRYRRWTQWPSAGPPPRFASHDHYESIVDGCLRSGAILDRAMVYWDIRLSDRHPTLEFRVSDVAAIPQDAVLLAVIVRALTHAALNTTTPAPDLSNEILRARLWRASRDGFTGHCPHPRHGNAVPTHELLTELLSTLAPVLRENNDHDFAREQAARLSVRGGGADRQRQAFERNGQIEDVVSMLAVDPVDDRADVDVQRSAG